MMRRLTLFILFLLLPAHSFAQQAEEDKEQLSHAIDYFNASKYQESAVIFRKLNKKYKINSRFKAYLALCEYKLWNYKAATDIFDEIIPELSVYSPQEQNVYLFAAAESHFQQQQFSESIKYNELSLTVCTQKEKADIYYKLAFCHLLQGNAPTALMLFRQTLHNYESHPTGRNDSARITQIRKMVRSLESEVNTTTTIQLND